MARCPSCGLRMIEREEDFTCPLCGLVWVPPPDYIGDIWGAEQRYKWSLVEKRGGGNRKAGRKRSREKPLRRPPQYLY
mgnify:CR=1 FL=1